MNRYIVFLLLIFIPASLYAGRTMEERRAELFGLSAAVSGTSETVRQKGFITIQSIKKGKLTGWVWKQSSFGGNQIASVDVKFKINGKGSFCLPCIKVYLFDKQGARLVEIDRGFLQGISEQKILDLSNFQFKGRKTYILRFPVPSDMIRYKNAVAVVGNGTEVYVKALRKSVLVSKLDFPEVAFIR